MLGERSNKYAVVTAYKGKELYSTEINGVSYFLLPDRGQCLDEYASYWSKVLTLFPAPDIVHIHGTEFPYGMSYIKAYGNHNVVISIQGLVSVIERYYRSGIDTCQILRNYTLRDVVRGGIFEQEKRYLRAGKIEKDYICKVSYVIGRTEWDRAHVYSLNPNVSYNICNETLRDAFYDCQWSYSQCRRYTIQCPASSSPIKGLHILLKALRIVKRHCPKVLLKIPGQNLHADAPIWQRLRLTGYEKYIKKLIKWYGLEENVKFIGVLNEIEMASELMKAHVFVCPSSIENSSNSLCEAQLMGVPCIASIAGGAMTIVKHECTGLLYRFEEYEQLAFYILKMFNDEYFAKKMSKGGREEAQRRHCKENNIKQLIAIYKTITHR